MEDQYLLQWKLSCIIDIWPILLCLCFTSYNAEWEYIKH